MGRALFAVLTATATFAACSSFQPTESSEPASSDAGEATTEDAGSGPGAEKDSAPADPTFCERQDAALFCDDFEQPGRSLETPAPWDALAGDAKAVMSRGGGFASPFGLRLHGTLGDGEGRRLKKIIPLADKPIRWAFRLRVDRLEAQSGGAQIVVASFEFASNRHLDYRLYEDADGLTGYSATNLAGSGSNNNYFAKPPVGLRFDDWMAVRIEFEPKNGSEEFRFFVGTELLSSLRLDVESSSTIALGARLAGDAVAFDVTADDVLVTEL